MGAAQLLLEGGASANAKGSTGGTPLHFASFFGHVGVARLLLRAGAKLDVTDMRKATPLQVAADEDEDMIQLLSEARERKKASRRRRRKAGRKHRRDGTDE